MNRNDTIGYMFEMMNESAAPMELHLNVIYESASGSGAHGYKPA